MNAYVLYVLECQSKSCVPMDKQSWMQLGMPHTSGDIEHLNWLKREDQTELNRRAEMFDRIRKGKE